MFGILSGLFSPKSSSASAEGSYLWGLIKIKGKAEQKVEPSPVMTFLPWMLGGLVLVVIVIVVLLAARRRR